MCPETLVINYSSKNQQCEEIKRFAASREDLSVKKEDRNPFLLKERLEAFLAMKPKNNSGAFCDCTVNIYSTKYQLVAFLAAF